LRNVFDGDILRRSTNARRWRNSADSEDPVDFVGDVTANFRKVQPRDVISRVGIRCVRRSLPDEHGVVDALELLRRAEVPDGRNPSGGVLVEIVLREDHVRGNDVGDGLD